MTPKKEAEELFDSFLKFQVLTIGFENDVNNEFTRRQRAKQCALICVNKILSILDYPCEQYSYYLAVKLEIERL
jgi:hypothetical protein